MWQERRAETGERAETPRKERPARHLWTAASTVAVAATTVVAAVLVFGGGLWWRSLNAVPTITVPAALPLPRPNAFDTFCKAGGLITDRAIIEEAHYGVHSLPKERNGVPYSDTEKAAAIARNAPALALLRSGFSKSYRFPSRRDFHHSFPEYATFRDFAYLLNIEGQVREASGDFAGAAESRLDAMQLGTTVPRGGGIFPFLIGGFCEGVGCRSLWALTDNLTGSEARAAAKRLETITARRVSFTDSLTEEKWFVEAGLLQEFQSKSTLALCQKMYIGTSASGPRL